MLLLQLQSLGPGLSNTTKNIEATTPTNLYAPAALALLEMEEGPGGPGCELRGYAQASTAVHLIVVNLHSFSLYNCAISRRRDVHCSRYPSFTSNIAACIVSIRALWPISV